ncbi:MAG: rod shape-determining protein MreD [Candidatus Latescibacterota bacterium]
MRIIFLIVVTFVFLLLQVLALGNLSIGEISPDFALLLSAFLALYRGPVQGSILAFLIGFIQDVFNPALLGLNALTKTLIGFGFGHVGQKAVPERAIFFAAIFFIAALGHDILYLLFFTGLHFGRFFVLLFTVAVPSAVYTAIVGAVIHSLLLFVDSRMVRSGGKER